jgi:acetyltransferase-like isoleucine patch superfamily enzyme
VSITIEADRDVNDIRIDEDTAWVCTGTIRVRGRDNRIRIGKGSFATNVGISVVGDGNRMALGNGWSATRLKVQLRHGSVFRARRGWNVAGGCAVSALEGPTVQLGIGCLFADEIVLMTSDFHPVLDAASGARLNTARDITLGDHVWIGLRALILKGATIGANAVIGAGSVVTGEIPAACVAAGNPARVIRRDVTWSQNL